MNVYTKYISIKQLLTGLTISLLTFNVNAAPNYLQYKYNDAVTIVISNVACPYPQMKSEYPYASAAFRIDGEKLSGCYKRQDENLIEISWYKGDKTVIPANAFLVNPNGIQAKPIEPTL